MAAVFQPRRFSDSQPKLLLAWELKKIQSDRIPKPNCTNLLNGVKSLEEKNGGLFFVIYLGLVFLFYLIIQKTLMFMETRHK